MKGPHGRLRHDFRRVWECPVCHHRERTGGDVTFRLCLCQRKAEVEHRVWMRLVQDGARRADPYPSLPHEPPSTPPDSSEEPAKNATHDGDPPATLTPPAR